LALFLQNITPLHLQTRPSESSVLLSGFNVFFFPVGGGKISS
jgi:hypothetical protein